MLYIFKIGIYTFPKQIQSWKIPHPPFMAHLLYFWTLISIEFCWRNNTFPLFWIMLLLFSPREVLILCPHCFLSITILVFHCLLWAFISLYFLSLFSTFLGVFLGVSALARMDLNPQPQQALSVHLVSAWSRQQICSYTATGTFSGSFFLLL